MANALNDSIPTLCIWWDRATGTYLVESYAINNEMGTAARAGVEMQFDVNSMKSDGVTYVLRDLRSYGDRVPVPRSADPKAAIKAYKEQRKRLREIGVSLYSGASGEYLRVDVMDSNPQFDGACSKGAPIIILLPTSPDLFGMRYNRHSKCVKKPMIVCPQHHHPV